MNETVEVDGSILNIMRKYRLTQENGKVRYEDCYIISKDGVVIIECPVRKKDIMLKFFRDNADMSFYSELKNKEKES